MKKRTILITALLLAAHLTKGQTPCEASLTRGLTLCEVWTMDDCIAFAIQHGLDVQKRQVETAVARTDVGIALSDFLPSVSANAAAQYSWGRNVDPETNTYNTVTTFNNYYSLYASLQLFDGGQTINRFRQARLARRQSQTRLQQAQDEKAIDVMQKYVDAVYAQECVALATEKLDESRALLRQTQRMEELGIKSLPDVAQIESQVAEDDYGLTHSRNQLQTAMAALKSAMNFPEDERLEVRDERYDYLTSAGLRAEVNGTDCLTSAGLGAGVNGTDSLTSADQDAEINGMQGNHISHLSSLISHLPAAYAAEQSLRSAELNYEISKGRLLPSLSLQAGVSTSYYRNLTGGGPASPFHSQFWDNMGEYVAASLSLPIFDLSRYKNVRKARLNVELARLERDETLRRLSDDARQASLDCEGYGMEVQKMARKVDADSLAYHLSQRKYEEGMLSTFDLHTASQTLHDSRIRLLQTRMLYAIKQRLVTYYQTGSIMEK